MWGGEAAGNYWGERYFLDRVLENYEGSVYLIQGMHDWNVDPHMAIPVINQLKDVGIGQRAFSGSGITITRTVQLTTSTDRARGVVVRHSLK